MNHLIFALYVFAVVSGIACSINLLPLRKKYTGLSEALIINWLLAIFTFLGAVILYITVNLDPAVNLVRILLFVIGLILSGLTIFLPRQVNSVLSSQPKHTLKANSEKAFGLLALVSVITTASMALFTKHAHLWSIAVPVLSLVAAVIYCIVVQCKSHYPINSSVFVKRMSMAFPPLCIALGLGEGLFFGSYVLGRGVTISLPLIYLIASLLLWRYAKDIFPVRTQTISQELNCPSGLTPKEFEIASAVYQGLSNKQIADQLEVSPSTVKNHLYSVFKKLSVTNRVALIKRLEEPQA